MVWNSTYVAAGPGPQLKNSYLNIAVTCVVLPASPFPSCPSTPRECKLNIFNDWVFGCLQLSKFECLSYLNLCMFDSLEIATVCKPFQTFKCSAVQLFKHFAITDSWIQQSLYIHFQTSISHTFKDAIIEDSLFHALLTPSPCYLQIVPG
jgi:hypothetical protein